MIKLALGISVGLLASLWSMAANAAENWSAEITPYVWLAGIDADITVGDRTGSVDVGFEDLVDYVDVAGGLLLTVQKNRWVFWLQSDYMSLDSDEAATRFDELGRLQTDITIVEAAFGYQFDNPLSKSGKVDVLIGGRYTKVENQFDSVFGGTHETSKDMLDPMLVLRPWFPITQNLTFNPTLAIGGGADADLIYELQPQLQYQFTDNIALRFGYRRLYYDIEGSRGKFDGVLHGAFLGLGVKF